MPTELERYISGQPNIASPAMHLMHCTTAAGSLKVLQDRVLKPRHCEVYKTDLIYMFYGRPAYKPPANALPTSITDLAPVCLILDPSVLRASVRLLPFDSGGFDRYGPLVGPHLGLADFEMAGGAPQAPLRLVGAFYGTNANYYMQQPSTQEALIDFSEVTARAYARLIADPSIRNDDDRCGTVEVQFASDVALTSALKAIVGPAAFFDDPQVSANLLELGDVTPLPYKMYGRWHPNSFVNSIYEKVEDFLIREGVFQ